MEEKERWISKAFFLGIVFFLAIFMVKPIGISKQYSMISGILYHLAEPSLIREDSHRSSGYRSSNLYFDKNEGELAEKIKNPWNYDLIFLFSIPIGAIIAHLFLSKQEKMYARKNKRQITYEEEFIEITKVRWKRSRKFLRAFLAGILLLYGAELANADIDGQILSALMQGSISAYLFAAIVFAVAIPVAIVSGYDKSA
ncbi:YeeE/YedE family protein [Anaerosacchariphilus polymeriproducens]|uniref:Uncharacterized protein n=1 Tax=Anaerosacchariphilus polymeriproducens TaxID=1812858 RepID=A0A371AW51_9FIRM|nr:YeeE/YedE family protein [Anaerosacchariphilus polymeriproducens]RDU23769.1 hypothetical protein DWV06_07890 [Anaerosacchariphilus polymeriproducens]